MRFENSFGIAIDVCLRRSPFAPFQPPRSVGRQYAVSVGDAGRDHAMGSVTRKQSRYYD